MVTQYGPKNRRRRAPPDPAFDQFMSDDEKRAKELKDTRGLHLADVGLPLRTVNTLEDRGKFLVGQLADMTREQILEIDNIGETTLVDCAKRLDRLHVPHEDWKPPKKPTKKKVKK